MSAAFPQTVLPFVEPGLSPAQFTVDEYLGMVAAGAFDDVGRMELLEGYLVRKMTKNPPHAVAVGLLDDVLSANVPPAWYVANQESLRLDDSVPEPNLMIVAGTRRDYTVRHPEPADVALVIEVADTSLRKDRRKAISYARNRIPEYWIVNLIEEQIEVFEQPEGSGEGASYREVKIFHSDEKVPCVVGGENLPAIPIVDILP